MSNKVPNSLKGLYNKPKKNTFIKIPIPPQLPSSSKTKTKTKTKPKPKHNIFATWKFPKEKRTTYWNKVSPTRLNAARDAYKTNKRSIRRVMKPIPPKLAEKAALNIIQNSSRKPQSGNSRVASLPYKIILNKTPVKEWKPVPGERIKAEIAALKKSRQYPKYTKPKP